jgi:hypothetical protein
LYGPFKSKFQIKIHSESESCSDACINEHLPQSLSPWRGGFFVFLGTEPGIVVCCAGHLLQYDKIKVNGLKKDELVQKYKDMLQSGVDVPVTEGWLKKKNELNKCIKNYNGRHCFSKASKLD